MLDGLTVGCLWGVVSCGVARCRALSRADRLPKGLGTSRASAPGGERAAIRLAADGAADGADGAVRCGAVRAVRAVRAVDLKHRVPGNIVS